jgi:hypothetical protein
MPPMSCPRDPFLISGQEISPIPLQKKYISWPRKPYKPLNIAVSQVLKDGLDVVYLVYWQEFGI